MEQTETEKKSRREYGTGSIVERKNRAGQVVGFQARVRIRTPEGKSRLKTVGTAKTESGARKLLRKAMVDRDAGRLTASPRQTVAHYLNEWLEGRQRDRLRYRTMRSYRRNCDLITGIIGHVQLEDLRQPHIRRVHQELATRGLSAQSVKQAHAVLHTALEAAVEDDLILKNPAKGKKVKPKVDPVEMETYSAEQLTRLFAVTETTLDHALFVVMATTGIRVGEIVALTAFDLDVRARTLTIRKAIERQTGKGLVLARPKSRQSNRSFMLSQTAIRALESHSDIQRRYREQLGPNWNPKNMVFPSSAGMVQDPREVLRRFHRFTKAIGLPQIRLHCLRHSTATILFKHSEDGKRVQQLLGHSTIRLTLDTYTHASVDDLRSVADTMDAAFGYVEKPVFNRS